MILGLLAAHRDNGDAHELEQLFTFLVVLDCDSRGPFAVLGNLLCIPCLQV